MNHCAKDLNPFRSIVASILFFYCKLEMIQFDKAGLPIHLFALLAKCIEENIHLKYSVCTYRRHYTFELCVLIMWVTLETETIHFSSNKMSKCQPGSKRKVIFKASTSFCLLLFFGGVQAVFFWRKTTSPL